MTMPAPLPLASLDPASASPRVRELMLTGKKLAGGMLPNMYRRMANAPAMFDTYLYGYERFRTESGFTAIEQEVVFLTISVENACDYCVAAHSVVADVVAAVPTPVTDAIRNGTAIPDAKLSALANFTREMLLSRGRPQPTDIEGFLAAGFTSAQVLEIVHAIGLKTISNYANHLMETPLDAVFRAREWRAFRVGAQALQFARRVIGR